MENRGRKKLPVKRKNVERHMIISDLHSTFMDEKAFKVFLAVYKDNQFDRLWMNGDTMDFPMISEHKQKIEAFNPHIIKEYSLDEEIEFVKENILKPLHEAQKKTPITLRIGNHCARFIRPNKANANAIAEILSASRLRNCTRLEDMLCLKDYNAHLSYNGVDMIADQFALVHGERLGENAAKKNLELFGSGSSGHCFDEETEILTPNGWAKHDTLVEGSTVGTFNRANGRLEFQDVTEVFKYPAKKREMIHLKGMAMDIMVTPEHGLWTARHGNNVWGEETAQSVYGKCNINLPLAAEGGHEKGVQLSIPQVRLIAWLMAEGSFESRWKKPGVDSIRLHQSDMPKGTMGIMEKDMTDCGIEFTKSLRYHAHTTKHGTHRNYDAYRYYFKNSAKIWNSWLSEYLTDKKKLPTDLLYKLSPEQAKEFLDVYTLADGCVNSAAKNSRQLSSNKREQIDFLQSLAVRCGWRSTINYNREVMTITINTRDVCCTTKESWNKVNYNGPVWCVTVPNGTLVVRRKGKTAITLNTHRAGSSFKRTHRGHHIWIESGCMRTIENIEYLPTGAVPNWIHAFATVTVDKTTGWFSAKQHLIVDYQCDFNGVVYR